MKKTKLTYRIQATVSMLVVTDDKEKARAKVGDKLRTTFKGSKVAVDTAKEVR